MNQTARRTPLSVALLLVAIPFVACPPRAEAQTPVTAPDGLFETLEYRHVGPVGNRITSVVGVPGDPLIY
ncbi:MAG: hypothetical protein ACR2QM_00145, partial [Longimicrobiales bacterium]